MTLTPVDYGILAATAGAAVVGVFVGFSGALAMLLGSAAAVVSARVGWPLLERWVQQPWARGIATLVLALVVFGLVRMIVRKFVNGLLAQPADALFGALASALLGGAVALAGAWLLERAGLVSCGSNILVEVLSRVGGGQ